MTELGKVLITGSSGFIGSNLLRHLQERGLDVVGVDKEDSKTCNSYCDISKKADLLNVLHTYKPKIVLHVGAIKDLMTCQTNKIKSWRTNVESTNTIVQYCKISDAKIIYISSDVIFDGKKGNYSESDFPNPINWYGKTKLHSEFLIQQLDEYAICRTAMVVGDIDDSYLQLLKLELDSSILKNQTLFPHYVYNKLIANKRLHLPSNIISSPTPINFLCKSIETIIDKKFKGVFNTAGSEQLSRHAFALKIAKFHSFDSRLIEIDNSKVSRLRPRNIGLDVTHTYTELGLVHKDWDVDAFHTKLRWVKV